MAIFPGGNKPRTPELEDLGGFTEGENEAQQEGRTCPRSYREMTSETQV